MTTGKDMAGRIFTGIHFMLALLCANVLNAQTDICIGKAYEIQSSVLSEKRVLNIYLPPDYNETDTQKYPVIYLLDGGMDEDFHHVTGLVQFNSQPWVGRVPRSIVVGITNADRKRDYTFPTSLMRDKEKHPTSGGSSKFISFVETEVQPFVTGKFRTNGERTIIGESLGGLLAAEILLTKPQLFDKYIIVSPSIWWDNASLLQRPFTAPKSKVDIYIGVGKEGMTPGEKPRLMEDDARLLKEKIERAKYTNVSVFFEYLPDESHATIAHRAEHNAFNLLYKAAGKK